MSDSPNIDNLKRLAKLLFDLLDKPEAGVSSWHSAVHETIDEIAEERLKRERLRTENRVDEAAILLKCIEGMRMLTPMLPPKQSDGELLTTLWPR